MNVGSKSTRYVMPALLGQDGGGHRRPLESLGPEKPGEYSGERQEDPDSNKVKGTA